jgi:iron complex outermembrane receptor protein
MTVGLTGAGRAGGPGRAGARILAVLAALAPVGALAQTQPPTPPLRIEVPPVIVTAQKEPADGQSLPVSVTAVSKETIAGAAITTISDAAIYAPNTFFSEFSARKLSFPRFRGISSGPGNPAITTYVDGVPQLHTNASSVDLVGVEQIELVRGAQSALFGRNAIGGLVNLSSARPSLTKWDGAVVLPFGNFGSWDMRGQAAGPLSPRLALGVAGSRSERDGFTTNEVSSHPIDNRSSTTGKAQLLWTPSSIWEVRAIVSGERARDGDYGLSDLAALRDRPFRAARDFEGSTSRDMVATTFLTRRAGSRLTVSTTTGVVRWKTEDRTDLDYTPLPLARRENAERALQFTQEVRTASASPVALSPAVSLRWQAGVFVFTQAYEQDAVNRLAPFVLDRAVPIAVNQHSPVASLDDRGLGLYGQGVVTVRRNLDLTFGGRIDHERKEAVLDTFFVPRIAPPTRVDAGRSFSAVSPNVSAAYRIRPERMVYTSLGRGFKAGGFNAASPAGREAFEEERAWHLEAGAKTSWADGRLVANLAYFFIDWQDLQLNVPNPFVPAQFYVANVGSATSAGVEAEIGARPLAGLDVFGAFGYTRARFGDGSRSSGADVSRNEVPGTPGGTASAGVQYSHALGASRTVYGRAEATCYGSFFYDALNSAAQDAYSLVNLRVGVRIPRVFVEAWTRNAFNTRYIPVALQYGSPSGFIGEMGRPRTFGLTVGAAF